MFYFHYQLWSLRKYIFTSSVATTPNQTVQLKVSCCQTNAQPQPSWPLILIPIPPEQTSSERASSPSQFRSERGEGHQISVFPKFKKKVTLSWGSGSRKSWTYSSILGTFLLLLPKEWGSSQNWGKHAYMKHMKN